MPRLLTPKDIEYIGLIDAELKSARQFLRLSFVGIFLGFVMMFKDLWLLALLSDVGSLVATRFTKYYLKNARQLKEEAGW